MATFQIKADSTTTTTTTTTKTKRTKTIATAKLTNTAGVKTRTTIKSYQHPPLKPHSEELEQQQQKPTKPAEVTATTAASAEVVVYQLKPRQSQVRNVLLKNNSQQQKQTQQQQQHQQQILEIQSQQQQALLQQQRGDTLCSDAAHSPHSLNHQQQQNQQQQQQQLQQQQQRPPRHHQHYHHHQQHQHPNISSRSTATQPHQLRHCRRCPLGLTARLLRRSSSLRLGTKFKFSPTDSSLFMMITMLVVVTVVISGNAVFAAQRDSYKPKDPHSLSNNANAIPNAISGTGNAVSNGNTNNVSNGNTNSNSASSHSNSNSNNGNNATNTDNDSQTTSLTSSTSAATTSKATTTTTLTTSTTTTTATSSNGASSYSLQKGGGSSSSGTSGINRNTIEVMDDGRNGPYFDKAASKNITALLGKTAYLNCRVKNLGNKTMLLQVSWVRHRDIHLLTVGRYTYTSDQRFRAIHQPQTEDWILQIKYPQHRDSGIYECQVSTTPHMSHYIHLNVVEPSTEIIGAPDLYIESGSTINLTCVILNSPEPPAYIFWNHNNAIINYDSPRGGVSVVTNKGETTTSFLLIKSARPSDSGHYQCNPSNAKPKSVTVHVLNGVSHSVSRGVPSSNAARGTGTSTNVSGSLSVGLSVDLLLQLSICHAFYATACSSKLISGLRRLLSALLAMLTWQLTAKIVTTATTTKATTTAAATTTTTTVINTTATPPIILRRLKSDKVNSSDVCSRQVCCCNCMKRREQQLQQQMAATKQQQQQTNQQQTVNDTSWPTYLTQPTFAALSASSNATTQTSAASIECCCYLLPAPLLLLNQYQNASDVR